MIEPDIQRILSESGRQTLETMFFTTPDSISADDQRPEGELVAVRMTFQGDRPGVFCVTLSAPVARTLAASFLGVEEDPGLTPMQVRDVSGEMANIICGAVLSELKSTATIKLSSPAVVHYSACGPGPDSETRSKVACRFELPGGAMVLYLAFEDAA